MASETVKVPLSQGGQPQGNAEGEGKGKAGEEVVTQDQGKPEGVVEGKPEGEENKEAVNAAAELSKKPEEAPKTDAQLQAEQATGFDLTPFSDEFTTTGKLSDESYKKLEEKGFTRGTVDTYIAGVQAQVERRNNALASTVGGVDNYNAIIKWGAGVLTEAEKVQAVKLLSGSDEAAATTYLAGLNARFVKEVGKDPSKRSGGGGSSASDVFASRAEQMKAMRDPRYHTDPKYRAEVTEKSIRSFSSKKAKKRSKTVARNSTRRARAKGKR